MQAGRLSGDLGVVDTNAGHVSVAGLPQGSAACSEMFEYGSIVGVINVLADRGQYLLPYVQWKLSRLSWWR